MRVGFVICLPYIRKGKMDKEVDVPKELFYLQKLHGDLLLAYIS